LISNITNRVYIRDIGHLWLTGDKFLLMKLGERGGVSSIVSDISKRGNAWPRLLTSLKGLQDIKFMAACSSDDVEEAETFDLLPPSVTRLKLLACAGGDALLPWFSRVRHRQPHPLPT
jgi:hypothetical protein